MERAENLYKQAAQDSQLSRGEQGEVWERLALAATYNGRPNSALDALEKWNTASPGAENSPLWQDAWFSNIRNLSPAAQESAVAHMWEQKHRSEDVRALSALVLMGRSWTGEQSMQAMPSVRALYTKQDMLRKQNLERIFSKEIQHISDVNLLDLSQRIVNAKDYTFPANIALLEDGRRGLGLDVNVLGKVQDPTLYADQGIAQKILTGMDVGEVSLAGNSIPSLAMADSFTPPSVGTGAVGMLPQAQDSAGFLPPLSGSGQDICLVLALPQSGPIANISQQVRSGAESAVQKMNAAGKNIQMQYVDTAQPNWLVQLQSLPLNCAVVGGPIQEKNLTLAKTSGATVQRNFFAFLPSLTSSIGQDEGIVAWRFFPSHQDQVNALLDFSRQLGINDFGSFFPADTYGTNMNGAFAAAVRSGGGTVRAIGYKGTGASVWNTAANTLFQPKITNTKPVSTATFSAVFIPDTWSNMDGIMAAFKQNGETRQLLLGTTIWGQSLAAAQANADTFPLAIFPAPLNPAQNSLGTNSLWTAIGYDFVQLGANLALNNVAPASLMNTKLQTAQGFSWTMSPINWDTQGKASQKLGIYHIQATGIVPADPNIINQRRAQAITQFDAQNAGAK